MILLGSLMIPGKSSVTPGESHPILYLSCNGSSETESGRDRTWGQENQRGQNEAQDSLTWETEGYSAVVTEMGNQRGAS